MVMHRFRKPAPRKGLQVRALYPPPSLAEASYGGQSPLRSRRRDCQSESFGVHSFSHGRAPSPQFLIDNLAQ